MNRSKNAGRIAFFILSVMICVLLSGCGGKTVSGSADSSAVASESISERADFSESETASDASAVSEPDETEGAEEQAPDDSVQMADSLNIPVIDSPCGSLMASDGEYIYYSYRANDEELGGLYRADSDFSHVEMIDRGKFAGLYLSDGYLYYNEGKIFDDKKFHCLETASLSRRSISMEEYQEVTAVFDQAAAFNLPDDNRHFLGLPVGGRKHDQRVRRLCVLCQTM